MSDAYKNFSLDNLPEGQELLEKLQIILNYMQKIDEKWSEYTALEQKRLGQKDTLKYRAFQPKMESVAPSGAIEKTKFSFSTLGASICLAFSIFPLIFGDIFGAAVCLAPAVLVYVGLIQDREKMKKIGTVLCYIAVAVLAFYMWFHTLYSIRTGKVAPFNIVLIIVVILCVPIAFVLSFMLMKYKDKKNFEKVAEENKKIAKMNEGIALRNKQIAEENKRREAANRSYADACKLIASQVREYSNKLSQVASPWFPKKYYYLYAVENFVSQMQNYQATTLKELVNNYEAEMRHNQIIEQVENANHGLNQLDAGIANMAQNQEEMIYRLQDMRRGLRFANILQAGNLVANMATADATMNINSALRGY